MDPREFAHLEQYYHQAPAPKITELTEEDAWAAEFGEQQQHVDKGKEKAVFTEAEQEINEEAWQKGSASPQNHATEKGTLVFVSAGRCRPGHACVHGPARERVEQPGRGDSRGEQKNRGWGIKIDDLFLLSRRFPVATFRLASASLRKRSTSLRATMCL